MAMAAPAADLPERLRATLEKSGVLGDLKSQLRARLVATLRAGATGNSEDVPAADKPTGLYVDLGQALAADFMRANGFDYSLSVFDSESRLVPQVRSVNQLAVQLHLGPTSPLLASLRALCGERARDGEQSSAEHGLLVNLLEALANLQEATPSDHREAGPNIGQAAADAAESDSLQRLRTELDAVDKVYDAKLAEGQHGSAGVEERLLAFQRAAEQRHKDELQREMDRFRASEEAKIRVEEGDRYRLKLEEYKAELQEMYAAREERLRATEQQLTGEFKRREKEFEAECYATRQRLLESMDRVSSQEAEVKRESTFNSRNLRLQTEAARHAQEQLELREMAMNGLREHFERQLEDGNKAFQLEWEERQKGRVEELDRREAKLRDEMALAAQQSAVHQRLVEDLAAATRRSDELSRELNECRETIGATRAESAALLTRLNERQDYEAVLRQSSSLRDELSAVRRRLSEERATFETTCAKLRDDVRVRDDKIAQLSRTLAEPSEETLALRGALAELSARLKQTEAAHNAELTRVADQKQFAAAAEARSAQATRELANLRSALEQTRAALQLEEARNQDLRSVFPSMAGSRTAAKPPKAAPAFTEPSQASSGSAPAEPSSDPSHLRVIEDVHRRLARLDLQDREVQTSLQSYHQRQRAEQVRQAWLPPDTIVAASPDPPFDPDSIALTPFEGGELDTGPQVPVGSIAPEASTVFVSLGRAFDSGSQLGWLRPERGPGLPVPTRHPDAANTALAAAASNISAPLADVPVAPSSTAFEEVLRRHEHGLKPGANPSPPSLVPPGPSEVMVAHPSVSATGGEWPVNFVSKALERQQALARDRVADQAASRAAVEAELEAASARLTSARQAEQQQRDALRDELEQERELSRKQAALRDEGMQSKLTAQREDEKQRQLAAQREEEMQRQLAKQREEEKQRQLVAQQEAEMQRQLAAQREEEKQRQLTTQREAEKQRQLAAQQEAEKQRQLAAQREEQASEAERRRDAERQQAAMEASQAEQSLREEEARREQERVAEEAKARADREAQQETTTEATTATRQAAAAEAAQEEAQPRDVADRLHATANVEGTPDKRGSLLAKDPAPASIATTVPTKGSGPLSFKERMRLRAEEAAEKERTEREAAARELKELEAAVPPQSASTPTKAALPPSERPSPSTASDSISQSIISELSLGSLDHVVAGSPASEPKPAAEPAIDPQLQKYMDMVMARRGEEVADGRTPRTEDGKPTETEEYQEYSDDFEVPEDLSISGGGSGSPGVSHSASLSQSKSFHVSHDSRTPSVSYSQDFLDESVAEDLQFSGGGGSSEGEW